MFLMKQELEYFAHKLKELREKKGISQYSIARQADIQVRQYTRYENGESAPTLPVIVKLANVLGVSTDLLMCPDHVDSKQIEDKKLLSFVEKIDKLDYQTKFVITEVMEGILAKKAQQEI